MLDSAWSTADWELVKLPSVTFSGRMLPLKKLWMICADTEP
jgi:hypothetical protein